VLYQFLISMNKDELLKNLESRKVGHKLDVIDFARDVIKRKLKEGVSAKDLVSDLAKHGVKTSPATLRNWAGVPTRKPKQE